MIQKEEEEALQVQFQVEVRLSSPEPQFSSFGDDYLRLLTGLGEDGKLRRGSLFATTGLIPFGVDVGLGHLLLM